MMNKYPLWKNIFLAIILVLGFIYAAPMLYGEDPAVQVTLNSGVRPAADLVNKITAALHNANLANKSIQQENQTVLIRFTDTDTELKARDVLQAMLGDDYTVAVNIAPATPNWLVALGAQPMKLGLDLRGGVHFALQVDTDAVVEQRMQGIVKNISDVLRQANIRYTAVVQQQNQVMVGFREAQAQADALTLLQRQFPELQFVQQNQGDRYQLIGVWSPQGLVKLQQTAIDQTMTTLRNRVNELGVAEPVVQQQGPDRISVDLPGIQDTARAQQILGGTATLEFRLVDTTHDPRSAIGGMTPAGSILYNYNGMPVLLKDQIILTGNSITDASSSFGEDGRPSVNISLGGGGESYFHRITGENIGKPLAIVYVETKIQNQVVNGQTIKVPKKVERVISIATIQSALPSNFQITGLTDAQESRNLSLLLRAGALPAPISIVEERTIGPQLGAENIHMGVVSIVAGFILAVVFMAFYYSVFGLIADLALAMNLVLLVAVLSILGMTLTLPGMAGIVLTVGMAVDANVLIFERIREELRNGNSIQASIQAGYERAFATIVDANVTTLIVALVLFGIGTGAVKGFAVTLSLGLLTSMLTGLMFTRAIVNAVFGGRTVKKLPIGI
jgi:preprotein translocase subunit SecD